MASLIFRLLIAALALLLAAYVVPGIEVSNIYIALLVALTLGLLNVIVRPVLIILTFPITLLSLGLFIFVINALLFWLVGSIVPGFAVNGFIAAFLGSLIVSVAGVLAHRLLLP